jgi:hypothetical protein
MKSSIKSMQEEVEKGDEWGHVMALLSREVGVEASARQAKALQRRREIKSGVDLLRVVLAYAVCDWSLRMVGIWCGVIGLGNLSDVAILKRLRNCQAWLGGMIFRLLEARKVQVQLRGGVRLRIMDGTWVSKPGSIGTDWRIHLSLDLGHLCVDGLEITDAKSGETFGHCSTHPGDIRMGDRGYAYSDSMGVVLASGGQLVVRINWQNVPLETPDGRKFDLIANLQRSTARICEQEVRFRALGMCFPLRLIVGTLPQAVADKGRHRLRKLYGKKGKTPDQRTLLAAGFVLLVTNLPVTEWPTHEVLQLYRVRWQVELLIKRMKSIVNLDHLRALDTHLSQVYLLGKMMAVLLLDGFFQQTFACCPTWFIQIDRPLNIWRLTTLFFDQLRQIVRGHITLQTIFDALPQLERFLCNSPRARPLQFAQARALLSRLSLEKSSNAILTP